MLIKKEDCSVLDEDNSDQYLERCRARERAT